MSLFDTREILEDFADVAGLGREWFCSAGHSFVRLGGRTRASAQERREYMRLYRRKWRAENLELAKERNRQYHQRRKLDPTWPARAARATRKSRAKMSKRKAWVEAKRHRERVAYHRRMKDAAQRAKAKAHRRATFLRNKQRFYEAERRRLEDPTVRAARQAYLKAWREKNRETHRAYLKAWRANKKGTGAA